MGTPSKESPSTAFGLSLAGGIIILLAGLAVMAVGAVFTSVIGIGGIGGVFGLVGVIWGILIVAFAALLRSKPNQHVGLGVAIILFSIFSWVGSFGGFVIGFLLSLVGGILAIAWKPGGAAVNMTVMSGPVSAPGTATLDSTKFCVSCGAKISASATFCNICGAKQPGN